MLFVNYAPGISNTSNPPAGFGFTLGDALEIFLRAAQTRRPTKKKQRYTAINITYIMNPAARLLGFRCSESTYPPRAERVKAPQEAIAAPWRGLTRSLAAAWWSTEAASKTPIRNIHACGSAVLNVRVDIMRG